MALLEDARLTPASGTKCRWGFLEIWALMMMPAVAVAVATAKDARDRGDGQRKNEIRMCFLCHQPWEVRLLRRWACLEQAGLMLQLSLDSGG